MFLSRLRLVLAISGLVFAIAGIAADNRIVIWVAIGLLAVAFLIRLVIRKRESN